MRRIIPLVLLFALAFAPEAAPRPAAVTVYATGDLHEHTGNLARIARFVKARKAEDPNVLFVDAGDWYNRGDVPIMFTRGEAMASLLGAMDYDALALGNHEDTFGTRRLKALVERHDLPVVAANLKWAEGLRPEQAVPWRIFRFEGVSVAVVGTTCESRNHRTDDLVRVRRADAALREIVPKLRAEADIVVLVAHSGVQRERELARAAPGIDLIVGGHDHTGGYEEMDVKGGVTAIRHPGDHGRFLAEVVLVWDGEGIAERRTRLISITDGMPEDAEVAALRRTWFAKCDLGAAVARTEAEVSAADVTRWLAAAIREDTEADAVIAPRVMVPFPLPKGDVTAGALLAAIPRYSVVRFNIPGADRLPSLLDHLKREAGTRGRYLVAFEGDLPAEGPVRVAWPCVHYHRPMGPAHFGLDAPMIDGLERLHDRTTWQIAHGAAKAAGVIGVREE